MQRNYPLWFAGLAAIILLLNGCIASAPFPLLNIQPPVSLQDLFLETDNLPRLANGVAWHSTSPHDELDKWAEMNAIAAMDLWFTYGATPIAGLRHTIVQFNHVDAAESAWSETRNTAIERQRAGVPVQFLYVEELPSLHADNVTFRCEEYASSATASAYVNCVARLQYDVFYVEVQTRLAEDTLARSQFYELMQAADEQMRPIWKARFIEEWQGLPLGPLGTNKIREDESHVAIASPLSLDETEQFYLDAFSRDDWIRVEQLRTRDNQFGGESFYLLFMRVVRSESRTETACVHGLSNPLVESTSFAYIGDCDGVRSIAEDTLTEAWEKPSTVEWREWQNEQLSIMLPPKWSEDDELFSQPYCQPTSRVKCIASFKYQTQNGLGMLSISSTKRSSDQTLPGAAMEGRRLVMEWDEELIPIEVLQVRLDSGEEAIQNIMLRPFDGIDGIYLTIDIYTDTSHVSVTGSVYGEPDQLSILLPVISAMARSVQIEE